VPHRLKPADALDVARRAGVTDRTRVSRAVQASLEEAGWLAADVEHAMQTATHAEAVQPPECWRLTGGTTTDGEPLTVDIDVQEAVVWIEGVSGA
jgi:hypothetical protein